MVSPIDISAEMKRRAFDYYIHHPSFSLSAIAAFLGVSQSTFRRLRQAWNWPPRPSRASERAPAGNLPDRNGAEVGPAALREAALSLAQITRNRIDALAKEQRSDRATDHDRTARTLAAYARTLTTAQALLEQEDSRRDDADHDEQPPRTIHELRDELARHLERIVAEEEACGSDDLLV